MPWANLANNNSIKPLETLRMCNRPTLRLQKVTPVREEPVLHQEMDRNLGW